MDGLLTTLRVLVSLAVVVSLVWYLARRFGHRGHDASREAEVRVLDRQSLSKHAGVAVVAAGDRRLLVGFADQGVSLITEMRPVPELPKLPVADEGRAPHAPRRAAGVPSGPSGAAGAGASGAKGSSGASLAGVLAAGVGVPRPKGPPARKASPERAATVTALPHAARLSGLRGLPGGDRHPGGLLSGSVLSPQTWHATVRAWQDRTVRR